MEHTVNFFIALHILMYVAGLTLSSPLLKTTRTIKAEPNIQDTPSGSTTTYTPPVSTTTDTPPGSVIIDIPPGSLLTANSSKRGCKRKACGKYSYKHILFHYKNLFLTSDNMSSILKTSNNYDESKLHTRHDDKHGTVYYTDGSLCCTTAISVYRNSTMTNLLGQEREIIQLDNHEPPSYQFILHASCIHVGCTGTCVVQYQTQYLLVLDELGKLMFDSFSVPTYCTCKNVF